MVPLVNVLMMEGRVFLTAMQLKRNPNKKDPTFKTTIENLKEDDDAKGSLPPCMKKVLKENYVMMPKNPPQRLPPRKDVYHKTELKEINKRLNELREGMDRFNGLLVTHTRRQDSDVHAAMMRRIRPINGGGESVMTLHFVI